MMRLLADENFNGKILRGILRVLPDLDVLRVQDTAIYEAPDPQVLEWAAKENRLLLTHDIETMVGFANERVAAGLPMPGVLAMPMDIPIATAIDNLLTILGASEPQEYENLVTFLPF